MQNKKNKKVFVGMSGGVDSSVSAAILKEQGYDVTGVYMKNWSGDEFGLQDECPWEQEVSDAKKVCKLLDIPFLSFNFEQEYREKVVEYFFDEYNKGRTPNPDIMCNKEIKFDLFLDKCIENGADFIATGHYAQVQFNDKTQEFELHKGLDANKDQTYFLYTLNQQQLSKVLFPVGHLQKSEVRELAEKFKLPNAKKKDSQGICFIGKIDVKEFLRKVIKEKKGNIVDIDTKKILGEHEGIMFYTIGQRNGLNLGGNPLPYFVVEKDEKDNIVYVALGVDNKFLFRDSLSLENLHTISHKEDIKSLINNSNLSGSIRYRQAPVELKIDKNLVVNFNTKVRAIAPGQSLVIYEGSRCVGGGVIFK